MNKYFEITQKGLSICLDTDIDYLHHFEVGEILCISNYYNPTLEFIINEDHKWNTSYKFEYFIIRWDSINSLNLTIPECAYQGYFKDISEQYVVQTTRDIRLNKLGI